MIIVTELHQASLSLAEVWAAHVIYAQRKLETGSNFFATYNVNVLYYFNRYTKFSVFHTFCKVSLLFIVSTLKNVEGQDKFSSPTFFPVVCLTWNYIFAQYFQLLGGGSDPNWVMIRLTRLNWPLFRLSRLKLPLIRFSRQNDLWSDFPDQDNLWSVDTQIMIQTIVRLWSDTNSDHSRL